jgi:(+)-pinoresinol hydroxylase
MLLVAATTVLTHPVSHAQASDNAVARGAAVYEARCAYCHDPLPEGSPIGMLPGVDQLTLKYRGELSPYITERRELANFEVLRTFLRSGAGSMPPFRRTEITDDDIAALAAFLGSTSSD